MKIKKLDHGYLVRLELGEELMETLAKFAKKENLNGGFFHGIGGATSARMGIYRLDTDKEYHFTDIDGPLEVISMNGDIAMVDGEQMVHCHATVCGPDLAVVGGHVDHIMIGATCEIFLDTSTGTLKRKHSEEIGLKLLELDDYEL